MARTEERSLSLYEIETGLADAVMEAEESGLSDEESLAVIRSWIEGALEKRDKVAAFRQHLIAQQEFAEREIDRLIKRKRAMAKHQERLEKHVIRVMEALEVKSLEGHTATFKLRKNPDFVIVHDESTLPEKFWRQPPQAEQPPPAPNKRAIKFALDSGETVPGADKHFGANKLVVD
ncbi:MAG: hypothetical protein GY906_22740 [bacterium]|nr:hypothetical protein [bacterium]